MAVIFDPAKRARTLAERGLDFADAVRVFEGDTLEIEDDRKDYGKTRIICFGWLAGWLVGWLAGRLVVVGCTPRGTDRHIFSMRKANEREQERIGPCLGL